MERKICGVFKHPYFLSLLSTLWLWEKNDHEWRVYITLSLICTYWGGMWDMVMVGSCLQSQCSELERQLERTTQWKHTVPLCLRFLRHRNQCEVLDLINKWNLVHTALSRNNSVCNGLTSPLCVLAFLFLRGTQWGLEFCKADDNSLLFSADLVSPLFAHPQGQ